MTFEIFFYDATTGGRRKRKVTAYNPTSAISKVAEALGVERSLFRDSVYKIRRKRECNI